MSTAVISPEFFSDPAETPGWAVEAEESLSSLQLYLDHDIRKGRLLTAEEEVELAIRIEAGLLAKKALENEVLLARVVQDKVEDWEIAGAMPGEIPDEERARFESDLRRDLPVIANEGDAAKDLFLESNLRLVVNNAKRYANRGLPLNDIIQSGNLGLIRAVEKFDYTMGWKFSTYATWWIRQFISREFGEQANVIRLPVGQIELKKKVNNIERELTVELGREPTAVEVAIAGNMKVEKVLHAWSLKDPVSLDAAVGEDKENPKIDFVPYVERGYQKVEDANSSLQEVVDEAFARLLTEREARILRLRFGLEGAEPLTLDQVGEVFGLTRERIRQIEKDAKNKIRTHGAYLMRYLHEYAAQ